MEHLDTECVKLDYGILFDMVPDGLWIDSFLWIVGAGRVIGDSKYLRKLDITIWGNCDGYWLEELGQEGLSRNQSIRVLELNIWCCDILLLAPQLDFIFRNIRQSSNIRCVICAFGAADAFNLLASALYQCENDRLESVTISSRYGETMNEGGAVFFDALKKQHKLSHLKIMDVGNSITKDLNDENSNLLFNLLIGNTAMNSYESNLAIPTTSWNEFSTLFTHPNCSLENLHLEATHIDDEGVSRLGDALRINKTLKRLSLGGKGFTDDGVRQVLCDRSSINSTFDSNHNIRYLSWGGTGRVWNAMYVFMRMNEKDDKSEVARQKILACHFDGGNNENLHVFSDLPETTLPHAIEWIGRNKDGFTLMNNLVRGYPTLLNSRDGSL